MRKALSRLARTSWDEIQTRLSQEFTKRADYALYRAGLTAETPQLLAPPASSPHFFFSPDELPGRIALLKQHLPSAIEETIQEELSSLKTELLALGFSKRAISTAFKPENIQKKSE